jgi:hypothetical protein
MAVELFVVPSDTAPKLAMLTVPPGTIVNDSLNGGVSIAPSDAFRRHGAEVDTATPVGRAALGVMLEISAWLPTMYGVKSRDDPCWS